MPGPRVAYFTGCSQWPGARYSYAHFTEENTEAQRGGQVVESAHSQHALAWVNAKADCPSPQLLNRHSHNITQPMSVMFKPLAVSREEMRGSSCRKMRPAVHLAISLFREQMCGVLDLSLATLSSGAPGI